MFRNYFSAALRNLVRNRLYAAINITGLAVGFAAAIFAALFVRDELTFDQWLPGYRDIYEVTTIYPGFRGVAPQETEESYRDVAAGLMLEFPEVKRAGRISRPKEATLRRGEIQNLEPFVASADPQIPTVLPFPTIAGDLRTALDAPDGLILTRAMARKYFDRDAPIGETIDVDGHPLRVAAVIEDWPSNTRFTAQVFVSAKASFSELGESDAQKFTPELEPYMMVNAGSTFLRLRPGASIAALQQQMPAFIDRHIPKELISGVEMHLRPLAAMHLNPVTRLPTRASLLAPIIGMAGIGILIIIAAAINFINMTTARAARRAVEVGVRKVTGAARRQLIVQFMGESLLCVLLGMATAVALVEVLLPAYQAFLRRGITFDIGRDPLLMLGVAGVTVVTGVLAGFYPAFVLSAFRPVVVLKSRVTQKDSSGVRRVLVVLQFAILIGLTAASGVTYRQTNFAMNEGLRFDKDQTLIVYRGCQPALKAEIEALPGVRAAACSWGEPGDGGYRSAMTVSNGATANDIYAAPVDLDYFTIYGIQPSAGRLFAHDRHGDEAVVDASVNPPVIINESAMHQFGFTSPNAALGQMITWRRMQPSRGAINTLPMLPSEIIGVVPDISMHAQKATQSLVYFADMRLSAPATGFVTSGAQMLNLRLGGRYIPETLKAIDRLWAKASDGNRPIRRMFIDQRLQEIYLDVTRESQVFAIFAGLAVLIAGLGLFSLAAFTVEQRTKEIGIRKSMGASRADILGMMVWDFTKPVLWANLIAWPAGYLAMRRWLESFAYHIDLEPWTFLAASALALVIAVTTVAGHALLVARAQPVTALRYE